jgi:hypothetical protein
MAVKYGLSDEEMKNWKQQIRFIRCVAGCIFSVGQGKERRNMGTTKNEEDEQKIRKRKKNWPEHLQRMSSETAPKEVLYYHPIGRRNSGRPRRR